MARALPRRAIVSGASRGIGKAIAARLAAEGWQVRNFDRCRPGDAPRGVRFVRVDLGDPEALDAALAAALAEGPVTGLVNNAAIATGAALEDTGDADFDAVLAVNMRAPMICARALAPGMRAAGCGRIVSISSRAHLGKAGRTAYAGSKGGILSMARVWALELAAHGVTSNVVAPGPVRTGLFDRVNPPEMPRTGEILSSIPVRRMGLPEDVAHATAFFMDERAGYVTGQVLYVCGGTTLSRGGS